jgi:diguanylate cyclase (GGDEF)-like protein
MSTLEKIVETLKKNQKIAQTFFEIEARILSVLNFKDFLIRLLDEIREKRRIPYVWVSLIKQSDLADMIKNAVTSEMLNNRVNFIDRDIFLKLVGNKTEPVLVNGDLKKYDGLILQQYGMNIRSLAMAPLTLDGEIIGSLNHGDESGIRYQPGMDTTLLRQLATIVSICLSNVMAHERLDFLASRDPLTGLLNRRVMEQILKREFERAVRYVTPLTIVFLDLDGFKMVNDQYGHKTGDDMLKYVASRLLQMTRGIDIAARFAGDEFIIILPNTTYPDACEFAERLQTFFLSHPMKMDDGISVPVALSFGVSHIEDKTSDSAQSLLQRADKMLYEAKNKKYGHQ